MSDDLIGGLISLFFVLLLAALAIYLIILAIPFILYGASVYYSGRQLYRQTQRYELSGKSKACLAGIGLGSIVLSAMIVLGTDIPHFFIIPISVLMFLVASIATLGIWAYSKRQPLLSRTSSLKEKENRYLWQIENNKREIARLNSQNQGINQKYGDLLQEKEQLIDIVRELCKSNAQVMSLKKRKLEEEYKKLSDEELKDMKEQMLVLLKKEPSEMKLLLTLKASLLRIEELERAIGRPDESLKRNQDTIDKLSQQNQNLSLEIENIRQERARTEGSYQAFSNSRIVLD